MTTTSPASVTDPDEAYTALLDADPGDAAVYARTVLDSGEGELIISLAIQIASRGVEIEGIDVNDCQEAIIDTGVGEWMYDFATTVPDADIDRLCWETQRTGNSRWTTAFAHIDDDPEDEDWW